jgi:hypothetical protein
MRAALMVLPLLGLAACDPPFEQTWPPETFSFDRDGRVLEVRAQYDPVEGGWFTRVTNAAGRLERADQAMVMDLVQTQVGPELCDGQPLVAKAGEVWNARSGWSNNPAKGRTHYMATNGEWQIVANCA